MNDTRRACAAIVLALSLAIAASGYAQGLQTGIICGTITTNDGLSLPGATVTVTSAALQGSRTTVTDVNGNYAVTLPAGPYTIEPQPVEGFMRVADPIPVTVGDGIASVDISFDTGIR